MLDSCFWGDPNPRSRVPSRRLIEDPLIGLSFECQAFNALLANRERLGIKNLFKCNAARVDGYVETVEGEHILIEVKETLGWGSVSSAAFEFLAGRHLLGLDTARGVLVFREPSGEWGRLEPDGAWGQLALHSSELNGLFTIGALRVRAGGEIEFPPPSDASRTASAPGDRG